MRLIYFTSICFVGILTDCTILKAPELIEVKISVLLHTERYYKYRKERYPIIQHLVNEVCNKGQCLLKNVM